MANATSQPCCSITTMNCSMTVLTLKVSAITDKEYQVGGSQHFLMQSERRFIRLVRRKSIAEDYRAEKVMFVIITDGAENSSREYTAERSAH